jgi:hypothetical protein
VAKTTEIYFLPILEAEEVEEAGKAGIQSRSRERNLVFLLL